MVILELMKIQSRWHTEWFGALNRRSFTKRLPTPGLVVPKVVIIAFRIRSFSVT